VRYPQTIYCTLPNPIAVTAGELAVELFPQVVISKDDGIRRLIDDHGLKIVIYLGDDGSDTDVFRMLRGLRTRGNSQTLVVLPHANMAP
jgi:trehalose-6-phosphatase